MHKYSGTFNNGHSDIRTAIISYSLLEKKVQCFCPYLICMRIRWRLTSFSVIKFWATGVSIYQLTGLPCHLAQPAKRLVGRPQKRWCSTNSHLQTTSLHARDSQHSNRLQEKENATRSVHQASEACLECPNSEEAAGRCYGYNDSSRLAHITR